MTLRNFSTVAITGTTGYLGGVLQRRVASTGAHVIALNRTASGSHEKQFRLGGKLLPDLLDGVDLLIHCAYDMTARDPSEIWDINVEGTRRLLDLAIASGVTRIVVLSSMSAYEGTRQLYGQAKLQIERDAMDVGAITIRPGLVYGPRAGGMVGKLQKLVRLPVVPLIGGAAVQFTVQEDDLAEAVWTLIEAPQIPAKPIGLANPVPVSFRHILERLAWDQGRDPRFLPIGWRLFRTAFAIAEGVGLPLPIRGDSLLGLLHPAPEVPNMAVLSDLGIHLRRFGQPVPPPLGRSQDPLAAKD